MPHALSRLLRAGASRSLALGFALSSFLLASWFTRIPAVQGALGLGLGVLSLALLGLSLGTLATMPWAGRLVRRCGAGRLAWRSSLLFCLSLLGPVLARDAVGLVLALTLLGAVNGVMVVALNAAALGVEARLGVAVMAAFHGMYSLGGILGALTGSLAAALELGYPLHLGLLSLAAFLVMLGQGRMGEAAAGAPGPSGLAMPRGPLVGLGLAFFVASLGEGSVADWSAVHLAACLGSAHEVAGLGYALFAVGMTLGRLYGDGWRDRLGEVRIVRGGALLAAAGLGLGLLLGQPLVALAGYGLAGIGLAGIGPIVLRRAAGAAGSTGGGVAAVTGMGFAGFLAGPPLIGLLAELTGLGTALGLVPAMALGVGLCARRLLGAGPDARES